MTYYGAAIRRGQLRRIDYLTDPSSHWHNLIEYLLFMSIIQARPTTKTERHLRGPYCPMGLVVVSATLIALIDSSEKYTSRSLNELVGLQGRDRRLSLTQK